MTPDEIRSTARTAIDRFNDPASRDEYFDVLYDDDVVLHGYTPEPLTPKAAVKGFYAAIFEAFPDCRVATDELIVEGDVLAWRYRFAGTHRGAFNGIPPTGRAFEVPGMTMLRFGDRRCVERWSVTDFLSLMIQIGVVPPPGG
jgi:SnoaL-like polyketide cyclase